LGPGAAEEDVVLLGIAEDEDVVLSPVILPPTVVLFPDVAFCANVDVVVIHTLERIHSASFMAF
jgi:hypothetical protein